MADDKAAIGHGIKFERSSDGTNVPATFVSCGTIEGVKPPSLSRDAVDKTHNESVGGWREFFGGLRDGGEVSMNQQFMPGSAAEMDGLMADFNSDDPNFYRLVFKDGTIWMFQALLTAYEADTSNADKMMADSTYKVTGKPSFVGPVV